ncbi:MAG: response regulator transcription factor [Eubacteriales bacterium]|nr:response regulator transcription factor [Eubacteriales bacterium]
MAIILVVEDDTDLAQGLNELLTHAGHTPLMAQCAQQAETLCFEHRPQLILMDIMLPDADGLTLCRNLRAKGVDVPILYLTAIDDEYRVVAALDAGGDDYITKPFRSMELLSRIHAHLRRSTPAVFDDGNLRVDFSAGTAKVGGETVVLTPTEYQILSCFLHTYPRTLTRTQLFDHIWDKDGNFVDDNTLSVHVSRLRNKIGGNYIRTVRGIGYRFVRKEEE